MITYLTYWHNSAGYLHITDCSNARSSPNDDFRILEVTAQLFAAILSPGNSIWFIGLQTKHLYAHIKKASSRCDRTAILRIDGAMNPSLIVSGLS